VELRLPLSEMAFNNAEQTGLKVSPFEIVTSHKMRLCEPGMLEDRSMLTTNQREYYDMLDDRLKELHKAVAENREELKEEMKNRYDRENKARDQGHRIGQKVLLQSHRIKPRSDCLLAHKNYDGPFFITDACSKNNIGLAYRLVECETWRTLRRLISGDNLKPHMAERVELEARLPSRIPKIPKAEQSAPTDQSEQADGLRTSMQQMPPKKAISRTKQQQQPEQRVRADSAQQNNIRFYVALKISGERVRNGVREYLVHFVDLSKSWTFHVTATLLRLYRLQKEKIKDRRRKRRQQMRSKVRSQ